MPGNLLIRKSWRRMSMMMRMKIIIINLKTMVIMMMTMRMTMIFLAEKNVKVKESSNRKRAVIANRGLIIRLLSMSVTVK